MQLNGLTEFTLILTLAFVSESLGRKNWNITIQRENTATRGSNLIISCTLYCPPSECDADVSVYWKKRKGNISDGNPKNLNEFLYHENKTLVLERYRYKTSLVSKGSKNCSLKIQNVTDNDQRIYVRVHTRTEKFSFYNNVVSISVSDHITPSPEAETTTRASIPNNSSAIMYIAIFVPVATLVIVVILAGTFCVMKQKRKQSFTREESGYYANFSRASSNNAKSEVSSKKVDNLPELNDVEDPVYVNVKDPLDRMDQSIDNPNSIYANVNYSR